MLRLMTIELTLMAEFSWSFSISSGASAMAAGRYTVLTAPRIKKISSAIGTESKSAELKKARLMEVVTAATWDARRTSILGIRSSTAPENAPRRMIGTTSVAPSAPSQIGEFDIFQIVQAIVTRCSHQLQK